MLTELLPETYVISYEFVVNAKNRINKKNSSKVLTFIFVRYIIISNTEGKRIMVAIFNTLALIICIIISIINIGCAYLCMYMLPVSKKIVMES